MSTPEFQPKEYLVKSNIYPHDLIDLIEDMRWIVQGKKIAKNDSESLCGGGKPIGECATSTDMTRQIIGQFISGIEPELVDETKPIISNTVNPVSVDSSCEDCEMLCHAYGKTIDGEPSEKIRFMYEDPEAPSQAVDAQQHRYQEPVIPTSFDDEFGYFKLDPKQLP